MMPLSLSMKPLQPCERSPPKPPSQRYRQKRLESAKKKLTDRGRIPFAALPTQSENTAAVEVEVLKKPRSLIKKALQKPVIVEDATERVIEISRTAKDSEANVAALGDAVEDSADPVAAVKEDESPPPYWTRCYDPQYETHYFYNDADGTSSWEAPAAGEWVDAVVEEKDYGDGDFELEAAKIDDAAISVEPSSPRPSPAFARRDAAVALLVAILAMTASLSLVHRPAPPVSAAGIPEVLLLDAAAVPPAGPGPYDLIKDLATEVPPPPAGLVRRGLVRDLLGPLRKLASALMRLLFARRSPATSTP